jgi:hypothetical protein
MITHCFYLEKIAFSPNLSFAANLWSCDFFWILPDSPSVVSIFFCPKMKSLDVAKFEKELTFALADKIKQVTLTNLPSRNSTFHQWLWIWCV